MKQLAVKTFEKEVAGNVQVANVVGARRGRR